MGLVMLGLPIAVVVLLVLRERAVYGTQQHKKDAL